MSLHDFINLKDFVRKIYDWIEKDVDQAMGWDELGKDRSNYMADVSKRFASNDARVGFGHDLTWHSTWHSDAFDWPSL